MTGKIIKLEDAKSEMRATVSKALAEALICGIDQAKHENHELTQVQQIDLATMSIMSFTKALDGCENLDFTASFLMRGLSGQ